jgi:hypothetical protein
VDKLAFDIGMADGIEKTAISLATANRALDARVRNIVSTGASDEAVNSFSRLMKRKESWLKGKKNREYLHKRTGAGMEQLMRRAQDVKSSPVADKVVGSSKKKNIAMGLGAAAGVGALGAGAYGVNRALKDD